MASNDDNLQKILEARTTLWFKGILSWLLDANQKFCYDKYKDIKEKIHVWNMSRGNGKSYLLCVIAIEECLNNPKALVKYCCAKQKDARQIIQPLIRDILESCPDELRPVYNVGEGAYKFPNGAQIQLSGLDNGRAESLRGGSAVLCIVDEAGTKTLKDLEYIVDSILFPAVTRTKDINGKIILASTVPISASHPYVKYLRRAEIRGAYVHRTIFDNPRMTPQMIQDIIDNCGGRFSSTFRREYMGEIITDESNAVIPEFTKELQDKIVKPWPRPAFYDAYVAMDLGLKDFTAVLFAYYDFKNNKVIIEDEYIINGSKMNTYVLAESIKRKERELFSDEFTGEQKEPFLRVSDNNLIVINDLYHLHGLIFQPTRKDDSDSALNNLRMMLAAEQIIINPRCQTLIRHLRDATWNKSRKIYDRDSVDGSHFDACFLPETKIITSNGIKEIKDIKPGDLVLTHKGNFKPVKELLFREYEGDILEIKADGVEPFSCTPDHKIYSGILERYNNNKEFTGQLILKEIDWVRADNLKISEQNIKTRNSLYTPIINQIQTIEISKEMCFLYGYYVAEGSLGGNGSQIQFAGHKREVNVLGILNDAVNQENYYSKDFSRETKRRRDRGEFLPRRFKGFKIVNNKKTNGRNILGSCVHLHKELKKLGKSTWKKFPDWIYKLNEEQAFYMLSGYLFGDGHFSKTGIVANSISKDIIYGLQTLSLICGVSGNIRFLKRKNRYKGLSKTGLISNDYWTFGFRSDVSQAIIDKINSTSILNNIFIDKKIHKIEITRQRQISNEHKLVKSINTYYYNGLVYTLEVEDDHSYTVNGIAVKNCDAIKYLIRNVNFSKNPYPTNYGIHRGDNYFNLNKREPEINTWAIKKMMNLKK